jgi:Ser/Thr protein kinase RdoA (MazF antagonist)
MIDDVLSPEDGPERTLFDDIRSRLNRLIPSKENYGLIHYDFELDNLILRDDRFHIIDFDDCIYSFYVADIDYALREIFDHGNILDENVFDRFVCGYKKATALSDRMLKQIPLFQTLHDLMTYVRLKRAIEINDNDPLDPRILPVRIRLQEIILELRRSFG